MTHLDWEGCYNTRDLGGLPVAGGGAIRPGALIRSDILSRLTPVGRQALIDYGVKTVIDLRTPAQVAAEPSAFAEGSPRPGEPVYHILPLENTDSPHFSAVDNATNRIEQYSLMLDHFQPEIARIVQAVADAPAGGVLFHCHAGKDRTGIAAALLLGLAGVPDDVIAADYAASEERLWPLYYRLEAEAEAREDAPALAAIRRQKPICAPETMQRVLAYLGARYGGVEGYLLTAGLAADTLARIRRRLTQE